MVVMVTRHCEYLMPLSGALKIIKVVNFMLCVLYHNKRKY